MAGGGLMQLVAHGAQDIYLTGNPQITFFKVVYRRHTNFAIESVQQTFNGTANFGGRATCTVTRNGDLVTSAYLRVVLPSLSADTWSLTGTSPSAQPADLELCWTNYVGLAMIEYVTVEIGGQEVDKHYGQWMFIWKELTMTKEKSEGYKRMVGGTDSTGYLQLGNAYLDNELHIPLDFWFNINAGLALPLIALQYHEVRFVFQFRDVSDLVQLIHKGDGKLQDPSSYRVNVKNINVPTFELFIDYIYLDTDERRRFAQMSHEYLIEQTQYVSASIDSTKQIHSARLNFNHPCKELFWVFHRDDNKDYKDWFNFSSFGPGNEKIGNDILKLAALRLNGHYRFSPARGPLWFRQWQPFTAHTNIPDSNIYVYSFALRPEEHQPSGTCNMSRIDNATLEFELNKDTVSPVLPDQTSGSSTATLTIYARNYNVLRIMSGMGGLAYSN